MKLTPKQLKQFIKEELGLMNEAIELPQDLDQLMIDIYNEAPYVDSLIYAGTERLNDVYNQLLSLEDDTFERNRKKYGPRSWSALSHREKRWWKVIKKAIDKVESAIKEAEELML